MASPKTDSEDLLNAALPLAEKMLADYGEFLPYGQAMAPDGKIIAIGASDGREHPPSAALMHILKDGFKAGAKNGKYKVTALVYDVRVILPSTGEKSDAIAVSLNHQDQYAVLVFIAYTLDGSNVVLGETFAQAEENYAFSE